MPRFTKIGNAYEHYLAYIYHEIDHRGLLLNEPELDDVRRFANASLNTICLNLSNLWGFPTFIGAGNKPKGKGNEQALNIGAKQALLKRLKDLGYDVPKVRKKDEDTHEYEFKESAGELALQKLYADNRRWPNLQAGNGVKWLLEAAELITFRNRYINAKLWHGQYFSHYNVAATITGRRGSKKNTFGLGGNGQNFPARGKLSDLWKRIIIARPDRVFFFVDQVSAEDWPVQALSENYPALTEMINGINRHYKFASAIFGRSIDDLKRGRKIHDPQCEMEYYFGKKGRHANNYGMQPTRLNESLAGEGYSIDVATCKHILTKIDEADPNVKRVFHAYIQRCAYTDKLLRTPLGRERHVLGLRNREKNYSILNELYAWIPQSTIGDNTGLAIVDIHDEYKASGDRDYIVQESHDSICQEPPDTEDSVIRSFQATERAFNRDITFHNGITVRIPIEGKVGYNWLETVEIPRDKMNVEGVLEAYGELKRKYRNNAAERNDRELETTVADTM